MAESSIFEWLSSELENRSALSRLEARGTVRLVVKDAGLDPNSVRPSQMQVVVERLMPAALKKRGVERAEALCRELAADLRAQAHHVPDKDAETPYEVFERLENQRQRKGKP